MLVLLSTLAAGLAASEPAEPFVELPDEAPLHLGVALRLPDPAALQRFLTSLQDPRSPAFRAWLTPEGFGERFGLSFDDYETVASWFEAQGFHVSRSPNRLFLEAVGRVRQARAAFGVHPHWAQVGGQRYRTFDGLLTLPAGIAAQVLHVSGLDTRRHLRHRILAFGYDGGVLGADDLRLEYDMEGLTAGGNAAAGLATAVLATQEGTVVGSGSPGPPFIPPSTTAIEAYFSQIAEATATYTPVVLANSNDDFDTPGSNEEYQLDVEMQSVGAANANQIELVLSPASEVFTTGAEYVVNSLSPRPAMVSTSLGECESEETAAGGGPTDSNSEMAALRSIVQQGIAEGQTWFAAAGDTGADDCNDDNSGTGNGFMGGNATVDFPGSIPEVVDIGGAQFGATGQWDSAGNLLAYQPEVVWNEAPQGGAGGGGQSAYYAKPGYQSGVGPTAGDGARDVPDFSLEAASDTPGVAVYDCGSGQDLQTCSGENTGAGDLDIFGGTSVGSPLAAGIFAAVSSELGCSNLGDIHSTLYSLGQAQLDGGAKVFHDITMGNNDYLDPRRQEIDGFTAAPGYDLASGWGTLDVGVLVQHWPKCSDKPLTHPSGCSCATGGSEVLLASGALGVWFNRRRRRSR